MSTAKSKCLTSDRDAVSVCNTKWTQACISQENRWFFVQNKVKSSYFFISSDVSFILKLITQAKCFTSENRAYSEKYCFDCEILRLSSPLSLYNYSKYNIDMYICFVWTSKITLITSFFVYLICFSCFHVCT
jgi:hypothetical protein